MTATKLGPRAGMTLIEMLVGLMVGTLMLSALVGLFLSQSQLSGNQASHRLARDVVRVASQILTSDLRRLETSGGVEQASADSVTLRVPYSMGIVCASTGGGTPATTLSLLPTDSVRLATADVSGFAWRDTDGSYTYAPTTTLAAGSSGTCTSASIGVVAGGSVMEAGAGSAAIPVGVPALLYQRIRYAFVDTLGGSGLVRMGLESGTRELLVATFRESGTRFRFFVGASATAQDAPPSDLADLTGIELVLEGLGDRPDVTDGTVASEPLTVPVFFKNRTN